MLILLPNIFQVCAIPWLTLYLAFSGTVFAGWHQRRSDTGGPSHWSSGAWPGDSGFLGSVVCEYAYIAGIFGGLETMGGVGGQYRWMCDGGRVEGGGAIFYWLVFHLSCCKWVEYVKGCVVHFLLFVLCFVPQDPLDVSHGFLAILMSIGGR